MLSTNDVLGLKKVVCDGWHFADIICWCAAIIAGGGLGAARNVKITSVVACM
jgi:hypothetical protein